MDQNIEIVKVPGKDAIVELNRLRAEAENSGLYPILLGGEKEFERIEDGADDDTDPAETLRYAATIDVPQWFEKQKSLEPEMYSAEEGEWPAGNRAGDMGLITHLDVLTQQPLPVVLIAKLRLNHPWEAFAYLKWGNWNDCPEPAVHCALHRYWEETYGAEVVSITGDIVQCVVADPPQDRAASWNLARQQYIYCYDIVEQGTQTIAALAAGLHKSPAWYFWWD